MRYINIEVSDSGEVSVTFGNNGEDHFTKRELLRVIKTVKQESRQQVKVYRRKQRLKLIEETKDARNKSEQSSVERTETRLISGDSSEGNEKPAAKSCDVSIAETTGRTEGDNSGLAAAIRAKQSK